MKLWLLALAMILNGCARGALSDAHDSYMNVFGLTHPETAPVKGGYLGRALLVQNQPAQWTPVYIQAVEQSTRQPLVTTTNEKGGFYMGNLEPGAYELYVISPSGQSVKQAVTIAKGQILENDHLQLLPSVRLSGRVTLADRPISSGAMVYVPGTPFSALSDRDGSYYLDIPAGSYRIRAEKEGFQPYESESVTIAAATELNVNLAENPWPNGKVEVISGDGYLVRGLQTTLKITPVYGVRYMRMTGLYGVGTSRDLGKWIPIREQVTLDQLFPGPDQIQIEFMDQYGKISDPVQAPFYNVTLDESWKIYYGLVDAPVDIKAGEKVAFLSMTQHFVSSTPSPVFKSLPPLTVPAFADQDATASPPSASSPPASTTNATVTTTAAALASENLIFRKPVRVAEGAILQGGAIFTGGLVIDGTEARPVTFENPTAGEQIAVEGLVKVQYAKFKNIAIRSSEAVAHASFTHVSFENATLSQQSGYFNGVKINNQLSFTNVSFEGCSFEQTCSFAGAADTLGRPTPVYGDISEGILAVQVKFSSFNRTRLFMGCTGDGASKLIKLQIQSSNLLDPPHASPYFATTDTELAPPPKIQYEFLANYVKMPGHLTKASGDSHWPSFFGANATQPVAGAGAGG